MFFRVLFYEKQTDDTTVTEKKESYFKFKC